MIQIIDMDDKRYRVERDSLGRVVELDVWIEPKRTINRHAVPHWRSIKSKVVRERFANAQ